MTFEGPAVLDLTQHFVERWNEIKKRKVRPLLLVCQYAIPVLMEKNQYRDKE